MENGSWFDNITPEMLAEAFLAPLEALWGKVAGFAPNLIGALMILLIGYAIAWTVKKVLTGLLKKIHLDTASERVGLSDTLRRAQIRSTTSELMGKIVFWLLFLTFLIPAAETLELEKVSETIDTLIQYLPNVLGAALIVVVGLVVAYFVRNVVWSAAEGVAFQYSEALGKILYGVMVIIVAVLAVDQLQIETELLKRVIEIVLIAVAGAFAVGVGFGSQYLMRNVMAGFFLKDQYTAGTKLQFEGTDGTVEKVGAVTTTIKTKGGSVHVPNGQMLDAVITVK